MFSILSKKPKELQGSASQKISQEKLQNEIAVLAARAALFLDMYYFNI